VVSLISSVARVSEENEKGYLVRSSLDSRFVDCALKDDDVTITGNANNSASVKLAFISQFSQNKGTATITKMNDSTILWRILTKPKGEYYLPNQMVLTKR